MGSKQERGSLQGQLVSQWITSLAIAVVCCSVLFIVFAGYIVQLHETANLLTVRIEMMRDRQNHLESEMAQLRRTPVVQLTTGPQVVEPTEPPPAKATSENGVELTEAATSATAKDEDLLLSATGEISLPSEAMNPDTDIEKMLKDETPSKKK